MSQRLKTVLPILIVVLGVLGTRLCAPKGLLIGRDDRQLSVAEYAQAAKRFTEQTDRGQTAVVMDAVCDSGRLSPGLNHFGGGPKGAPCGVRVSKISGVR